MPPKVKISKKDIVQTALTLCRERGESAVNARSIAEALGCSTQPVFSNFATMEELQKDVLVAAYELYQSFLREEIERGQCPPYKAMGMAYIRFAKEEKQLFRLLFMCDRSNQEMEYAPDFTAAVEIIMNNNNVSREKAERMHMELWAFVHGIGTMMATSFFVPEWDMVSDMLSDVYHGLHAKHLQEETV